MNEENSQKKQKLENLVSKDFLKGKSFFIYKKIVHSVEIQKIIENFSGNIIQDLKESFLYENIYYLCTLDLLMEFINLEPLELPYKKIFLPTLFLEQKFQSLENGSIKLPLLLSTIYFHSSIREEEKSKYIYMFQGLGGRVKPGLYSGGSYLLIDDVEFSKREIHYLKQYSGVIFKNNLDLYIKDWLNGRRNSILHYCVKLLDLKIKKYGRFPNYSEMRDHRFMDFKEYDQIDYYGYILPCHIFYKIFSFLEMKEQVNMRLLSSKFVGYSDCNWKEICEAQFKTNFPKLDLKLLNPFKISWIKYYREFINPILVDRTLENQKEELMIFVDTEPSDSLEIGTSKLGGLPDLPSSITWPKNTSFVCQLNLSDPLLNSFICFNHLKIPKKGMLYFFLNYNEAQSKVLYYKENKELKRSEVPKWLNKDSIFQMKEMRFYETFGTFGNNLAIEREKNERHILFEYIKNKEIINFMFHSDGIFKTILNESEWNDLGYDNSEFEEGKTIFFDQTYTFKYDSLKNLDSFIKIPHKFK